MRTIFAAGRGDVALCRRLRCEQLRVWAADFAEEADDTERRAAEREEADISA
jgi:hypothetical protein